MINSNRLFYIGVLFMKESIPTHEEDDDTMRARLRCQWAARFAAWQARKTDAAMRQEQREAEMLREIFPKKFLDEWVPVFTVSSEDS
jgi:hypothetical protein